MTWIDIIIGLVVYFLALSLYTFVTWIIHRFYYTPYSARGQRIVRRYRVPWVGVVLLVSVGQAQAQCVTDECTTAVTTGWHYVENSNAGEARNYVLYTETYDHKPAFTRDLTKQECEFAKERALGKITKAEAEREREADRVSTFCKNNTPGMYFIDGYLSVYCSGFGERSFASMMDQQTRDDSDIAKAECFIKGK